jgi:hypothetical protein
MAKVSFTKLGCKTNNEVKIISCNGQEIEVKQYLSIGDKLDLISNILNKAHDENNNFSNPVKIDMYMTLEIFYYYTNINFTDKQKEDEAKLYDMIAGSGLATAVLAAIPEEEYNTISIGVHRTVESVYAYRNSALGILDTISTDYSNLNLDASEIQKKLADGENVEFLKEVMAKLG